MQHKNKVSVIILNYNGRILLKKCLESIQKNTVHKNYDIIVVDNNSSDKSIEMVRKFFPHVKTIQNPKNYGFPKGNNIGIKKTLKNDVDFVLLLNNDTEVKKSWLKEMIKVANSDKKIGIVGPRLILPNGKIQKNCYNYRYGLTIKFAPNKTQDVDVVSGACMLIKSGLIKEIGLLDEIFSPIYFEDIDYCFRAKRAGYRVVYIIQSKVNHHKGITMKKLDWRYETYHSNRIKFLIINFPLSWLLVRAFLEIWNLLESIKKKRTNILLSTYYKNFKKLNELLEKRRERFQTIH